uniref:Uncharacterized protein n=1 Tax=Stomoxys calcitrans TaxID=35570 RepID=A0A1I8PIU7_STOCA
MFNLKWCLLVYLIKILIWQICLIHGAPIDLETSATNVGWNATTPLSLNLDETSASDDELIAINEDFEKELTTTRPLELEKSDTLAIKIEEKSANSTKNTQNNVEILSAAASVTLNSTLNPFTIKETSDLFNSQSTTENAQNTSEQNNVEIFGPLGNLTHQPSFKAIKIEETSDFLNSQSTTENAQNTSEPNIVEISSDVESATLQSLLNAINIQGTSDFVNSQSPTENTQNTQEQKIIEISSGVGSATLQPLLNAINIQETRDFSNSQSTTENAQNTLEKNNVEIFGSLGNLTHQPSFKTIQIEETSDFLNSQSATKNTQNTSGQKIIEISSGVGSSTMQPTINAIQIEETGDFSNSQSATENTQNIPEQNNVEILNTFNNLTHQSPLNTIKTEETSDFPNSQSATENPQNTSDQNIVEISNGFGSVTLQPFINAIKIEETSDFLNSQSATENTQNTTEESKVEISNGVGSSTWQPTIHAIQIEETADFSNSQSATENSQNTFENTTHQSPLNTIKIEETSDLSKSQRATENAQNTHEQNNVEILNGFASATLQPSLKAIKIQETSESSSSQSTIENDQNTSEQNHVEILGSYGNVTPESPLDTTKAEETNDFANSQNATENPQNTLEQNTIENSNDFVSVTLQPSVNSIQIEGTGDFSNSHSTTEITQNNMEILNGVESVTLPSSLNHLMSQEASAFSNSQSTTENAQNTYEQNNVEISNGVGSVKLQSTSNVIKIEETSDISNSQSTTENTQNFSEQNNIEMLGSFDNFTHQPSLNGIKIEKTSNFANSQMTTENTQNTSEENTTEVSEGIDSVSLQPTQNSMKIEETSAFSNSQSATENPQNTSEQNNVEILGSLENLAHQPPLNAIKTEETSEFSNSQSTTENTQNTSEQNTIEISSGLENATLQPFLNPLQTKETKETGNTQNTSEQNSIEILNAFENGAFQSFNAPSITAEASELSHSQSLHEYIQNTNETSYILGSATPQKSSTSLKTEETTDFSDSHITTENAHNSPRHHKVDTSEKTIENISLQITAKNANGLGDNIEALPENLNPQDIQLTLETHTSEPLKEISSAITESGEKTQQTDPMPINQMTTTDVTTLESTSMSTEVPILQKTSETTEAKSHSENLQNLIESNNGANQQNLNNINENASKDVETNLEENFQNKNENPQMGENSYKDFSQQQQQLHKGEVELVGNPNSQFENKNENLKNNLAENFNIEIATEQRENTTQSIDMINPLTENPDSQNTQTSENPITKQAITEENVVDNQTKISEAPSPLNIKQEFEITHSGEGNSQLIVNEEAIIREITPQINGEEQPKQLIVEPSGTTSENVISTKETTEKLLEDSQITTENSEIVHHTPENDKLQQIEEVSNIARVAKGNDEVEMEMPQNIVGELKTMENTTDEGNLNIALSTEGIQYALNNNGTEKTDDLVEAENQYQNPTLPNEAATFGITEVLKTTENDGNTSFNPHTSSTEAVKNENSMISEDTTNFQISSENPYISNTDSSNHMTTQEIDTSSHHGFIYNFNTQMPTEDSQNAGIYMLMEMPVNTEAREGSHMKSEEQQNVKEFVTHPINAEVQENPQSVNIMNKNTQTETLEKLKQLQFEHNENMQATTLLPDANDESTTSEQNPESYTEQPKVIEITSNNQQITVSDNVHKENPKTSQENAESTTINFLELEDQSTTMKPSVSTGRNLVSEEQTVTPTTNVLENPTTHHQFASLLAETEMNVHKAFETLREWIANGQKLEDFTKNPNSNEEINYTTNNPSTNDMATTTDTAEKNQQFIGGESTTLNNADATTYNEMTTTKDKPEKYQQNMGEGSTVISSSSLTTSTDHEENHQHLVNPGSATHSYVQTTTNNVLTTSDQQQNGHTTTNNVVSTTDNYGKVLISGSTSLSNDDITMKDTTTPIFKPEKYQHNGNEDSATSLHIRENSSASEKYAEEMMLTTTSTENQSHETGSKVYGETTTFGQSGMETTTQRGQEETTVEHTFARVNLTKDYTGVNLKHFDSSEEEMSEEKEGKMQSRNQLEGQTQEQIDMMGGNEQATKDLSKTSEVETTTIREMVSFVQHEPEEESQSERHEKHSLHMETNQQQTESYAKKQNKDSLKATPNNDSNIQATDRTIIIATTYTNSDTDANISTTPSEAEISTMKDELTTTQEILTTTTTDDNEGTTDFATAAKFTDDLMTTTTEQPEMETTTVLVLVEPEPRSLAPPKLEYLQSDEGVEVFYGYSIVKHN